MLPAAKAITSTGELSETNQQNVVIWFSLSSIAVNRRTADSADAEESASTKTTQKWKNFFAKYR